MTADSPQNAQRAQYSQHAGNAVRLATAADIADIDELIKSVWEDPLTDLKCLHGESRYTARELPAYLGDAENILLVHESHEASAKAITGVLFLSRVAPTVFDLGIIACPQGQGVGSRLIDAAFEASTRGGISEIYLDVFERNPAIRLYERKGFASFDRTEITNQRGESLPLVRMRLALPKVAYTPGHDSRPSRQLSSFRASLKRLLDRLRKTMS